MQNYYFPKYYTTRAIALYYVLLLTLSVVFFDYAMQWYWVLFGSIQVIGFFYFANRWSRQRADYSEKLFLNRLFWVAFGIRLVYVCVSYLFYWQMTGIMFEFGAADGLFYDDIARYGADLISNLDFHFYERFDKYCGGLALGDTGYPIYLSFIYFITGKSIFLSRLIKCLWSSWTCVLIYRIAQRNFDEHTARLSAILCALMPNLFYYCGLQLKETEMLFMVALFIERCDYLLRAQKLLIGPTILVLLLGTALFFFRTVLGAVAFLSIGVAIVMSSSKTIGWGRRIVIILLAIGFIGITFKGALQEEVNDLTRENIVTRQQHNMAWRSQRDGTNNQLVAKYAGAAVFAPLIFTIPFPTMVETPGQENQRMIHGGNFVKNITSFFTILAMFMLLFSGEWRQHVLTMAFTCGYLIVLVFSNFAHSERFHLPVVPFMLMFAAYAIIHAKKKHKHWFNYWLVFIFVANVFWAWLKLSSRGL